MVVVGVVVVEVVVVGHHRIPPTGADPLFVVVSLFAFGVLFVAIAIVVVGLRAAFD